MWLHNYRLTPWDLGLPRSELDDAWRPAMLRIHAGYHDEMNRIMKGSK